MRMLKCGRYLSEPVLNLSELAGATVFDDLLERSAFDELANDEKLILTKCYVVDGRDIGMR